MFGKIGQKKINHNALTVSKENNFNFSAIIIIKPVTIIVLIAIRHKQENVVGCSACIMLLELRPTNAFLHATHSVLFAYGLHRPPEGRFLSFSITSRDAEPFSHHYFVVNAKWSNDPLQLIKSTVWQQDKPKQRLILIPISSRTFRSGPALLTITQLLSSSFSLETCLRRSGDELRHSPTKADRLAHFRLKLIIITANNSIKFI